MSLLLSKKFLKQAPVEKQRKQNSKTVRINTIKALETNQKLATTWGAFPQEEKKPTNFIKKSELCGVLTNITSMLCSPAQWWP